MHAGRRGHAAGHRALSFQHTERKLRRMRSGGVRRTPPPTARTAVAPPAGACAVAGCRTACRACSGRRNGSRSWESCPPRARPSRCSGTRMAVPGPTDGRDAPEPWWKPANLGGVGARRRDPHAPRKRRYLESVVAGSIFRMAPSTSSVVRYKNPSGPCLTSRIRCLRSASSVMLPAMIGYPCLFSSRRCS